MWPSPLQRLAHRRREGQPSGLGAVLVSSLGSFGRRKNLGVVGGPPGQEQPWSETLPQRDERSPRAVVPQRTAPPPRFCLDQATPFFQSGTSLESQKTVPAVQVRSCRMRGKGRAWPGFRALAFSPAEPFVCEVCECVKCVSEDTGSPVTALCAH